MPDRHAVRAALISVPFARIEISHRMAQGPRAGQQSVVLNSLLIIAIYIIYLK
jgi:hypothetical protein